MADEQTTQTDPIAQDDQNNQPITAYVVYYDPAKKFGRFALRHESGKVNKSSQIYFHVSDHCRVVVTDGELEWCRAPYREDRVPSFDPQPGDVVVYTPGQGADGRPRATCWYYLDEYEAACAELTAAGQNPEGEAADVQTSDADATGTRSDDVIAAMICSAVLDTALDRAETRLRLVRDELSAALEEDNEALVIDETDGTVERQDVDEIFTVIATTSILTNGDWKHVSSDEIISGITLGELIDLYPTGENDPLWCVEHTFVDVQFQFFAWTPDDTGDGGSWTEVDDPRPAAGDVDSIQEPHPDMPGEGEVVSDDTNGVAA